MMEWLLRVLPVESVLRWVAKQLTGLDDRYIDLVIEKVEYYDREKLPGYEKRKAVYEELRKSLGDIADWTINFLIELAVAYLRKGKS